MDATRTSTRFGPFELDATAYLLRRGERTIELSPKAIDLLFLFTARPGALITKDELLAVLWPDVAVTDNAITQVVSEARQALGDDAAAPTFIATVPRRGYRFMATVTPLARAASRAAGSSVPAGATGAAGPLGASAPDWTALLSAGVLAALRDAAAPAASRSATRETSSLEAYRALTLGRLALETLDPAEVPAATEHFTRALALEADYALAHVGLAHARFWTFQASRAATMPDRTALADAIAHARRAVEIDPELAEGHAALAFCLAAAERPREARLAGRIAVALEPANWRHQFRLAVASWGRERLECLAEVRTQFPGLAYAHYLAAMVHIARGRLPEAVVDLDAGIAIAHATTGGARFPAQGLHWLRGLVHLADGDTDGAQRAFDREIAAAHDGLFAAEFARDAHEAAGCAWLLAGSTTRAIEAFDAALARYPDHPRSLVGMARAHREAGHAAHADRLMIAADQAIAAMDVPGRESATAAARAAWLAAAGRDREALAVLGRLLDEAPPGSAGWLLPVDPWFAPLRSTPAARRLLDRLALRAE